MPIMAKPHMTWASTTAGGNITLTIGQGGATTAGINSGAVKEFEVQINKNS